MKYKTHREMRHEEYCARIAERAVKKVASRKLVSSTHNLNLEQLEKLTSFTYSPSSKNRLKGWLLNLFKIKIMKIG